MRTEPNRRSCKSHSLNDVDDTTREGQDRTGQEEERRSGVSVAVSSRVVFTEQSEPLERRREPTDADAPVTAAKVSRGVTARLAHESKQTRSKTNTRNATAAEVWAAAQNKGTTETEAVAEGAASQTT